MPRIGPGFGLGLHEVVRFRPSLIFFSRVLYSLSLRQEERWRERGGNENEELCTIRALEELRQK